jgi:hypothetical protein
MSSLLPASFEGLSLVIFDHPRDVHGTEEYTYKFLREEEYEGQATFVIERYPVDPKSGYTRQAVWFVYGLPVRRSLGVHPC